MSSAHAFFTEDPAVSATKIVKAPVVLEIRMTWGIATNHTEGQLLVKHHKGRFRSFLIQKVIPSKSRKE